MSVFPRIQLSLSSSAVLPGCAVPCFSVVRLIEVGSTHVCIFTYEESQQSSTTTRCSLFSMQGGGSILNVGGGAKM